jgi:hypothetical protein
MVIVRDVEESSCCLFQDTVHRGTEEDHKTAVTWLGFEPVISTL